MMTALGKNTLYLVLGGVVLMLAPLLITSKFCLDVLTLIFFTAYLGQSWNILGYAGQFSFGGVMFFGTGAYASSDSADDVRYPADYQHHRRVPLPECAMINIPRFGTGCRCLCADPQLLLMLRVLAGLRDSGRRRRAVPDMFEDSGDLGLQLLTGLLTLMATTAVCASVYLVGDWLVCVSELNRGDRESRCCWRLWGWAAGTRCDHDCRRGRGGAGGLH